jgi:hypothetical protein
MPEAEQGKPSILRLARGSDAQFPSAGFAHLPAQALERSVGFPEIMASGEVGSSSPRGDFFYGA